MTDEESQDLISIALLNKMFLMEYPAEAARKIESMLPKLYLTIFKSYNPDVLVPMWNNLVPGAKQAILTKLPNEVAATLLAGMDANACATLLRSLETKQRVKYLALLDESYRIDVIEFMEYPIDSAGYMMDSQVIAFNENITVGEAISQLKGHQRNSFHYLFVLDNNMHLSGQIDMQEMAISKNSSTLRTITHREVVSVNMFDSKDDVINKFQKFKINTLPVVDGENRIVGVIHESKVISSLEESVVGDIQTMVGASKDEKALSSVLFKVQKRQPWLQVNLVTAFMAAAVVGLFEGMISEYTALAILLPVVAGQSGNTGAQALAVTMRSLTLREVTTKQWITITFKESLAALVNGVLISTTCAIAVLLWSNNTGLTLIIFLAMMASMLMAAVAGALTPIILKKLGQDPALSSSIILSTITDIAGFMAFLGIATILAHTL